MTRSLIALVEGHAIGDVRRDKAGRLSFLYDAAWRSAPDAFPLSLSMPLVVAEHEHRRIEPWLWGLLPDNEAILQRWAQRFQVSAKNVLALLEHVGEDCAGAVQLVRPERAAMLHEESAGAIDWLDEADIAARLRRLREDGSAWRMVRDRGQFSLAGAQPKTALYFDGARWGLPSGRIPTTHILKPPVEGFDGHAENEHFCLALARAIGLPAAQSRVMRFAKDVAIVVERFDRVPLGNRLIRLHQEDLCQARSVPPSGKYEKDGGPGVAEVVETLRLNSSRPDEDVTTFVDAQIFNWLIAGTDAHAKNYAILLAGGAQVRLAPLFDVASTLPYDFDYKKLRLAMRIGKAYLIDDIGPRQWAALAERVRLSPDYVRERCLAMINALPDAAAAVARSSRAEGLRHPIIGRLAEAISKHAKRCLRSLDAGKPASS